VAAGPAIFPTLTAAQACEALREAGLALAPADVGVERREERWAVSLPDDRIAWFPATGLGLERLRIERRVLRLLADRCTFRLPQISYESVAGYDVRAMVPGRCDPWGLFKRAAEDADLARRLGSAIGAILVEQHARIVRTDVEGWLPDHVSWPETRGWIRERIDDVVADSRLVAAIEKLCEVYERLTIDPADLVLVHADLGLHNLAFDPNTMAVRGVFDYDSAAWADRHHDFRYLVFSFEREEMLEAALAVYEPAIRRTLDRRRIWLYNAVCAASFLAFRRGVPPDRKWCGRTLHEDLRWVRDAISRALG
jgi:Phosphotransferase enzyme family